MNINPENELQKMERLLQLVKDAPASAPTATSQAPAAAPAAAAAPAKKEWPGAKRTGSVWLLIRVNAVFADNFFH